MEEAKLTDHREVIFLGPGEYRLTPFDTQPHYQLKALKGDTEGRFSAFVARVSQPLPLHVHDADESFYLLDGEMEMYAGDRIYHATPGTWMFLPAGIPHAPRPVGTVTPVVFCVQSPGGFEDFAEVVLKHAEAGTRDFTSSAFLEDVARVGWKLLDADFWSKQDTSESDT